MKRLRAVGGLCNRLQAILSYRSAHGSIEVVWDANEYVSHARPAEVFEAIPGITFVPNAVAWDLEDYAPCPSAPRNWRLGYRDLKPTANVQARIDKLTVDLSPYVAVHVRRTDMTPLAARTGNRQPTIEDYLRWIEQFETPPQAIYLATDNGETQRRFMAKPGVHVGAHLEGRELQDEADHHRNGTLADAVVDLFMCAGAAHFMGSGNFGSFTNTIHILRGWEWK